MHSSARSCSKASKDIRFKTRQPECGGPRTLRLSNGEDALPHQAEAVLDDRANARVPRSAFVAIVVQLRSELKRCEVALLRSSDAR